MRGVYPVERAAAGLFCPNAGAAKIMCSQPALSDNEQRRSDRLGLLRSGRRLAARRLAS